MNLTARENFHPNQKFFTISLFLTMISASFSVFGEYASAAVIFLIIGWLFYGMMAATASSLSLQVA